VVILSTLTGSIIMSLLIPEKTYLASSNAAKKD
jgi:hypothetical protein